MAAAAVVVLKSERRTTVAAAAVVVVLKSDRRTAVVVTPSSPFLLPSSVMVGVEVDAVAVDVVNPWSAQPNSRPLLPLADAVLAMAVRRSPTAGAKVFFAVAAMAWA